MAPKLDAANVLFASPLDSRSPVDKSLLGATDHFLHKWQYCRVVRVRLDGMFVELKPAKFDKKNSAKSSEHYDIYVHNLYVYIHIYT